MVLRYLQGRVDPESVFIALKNLLAFYPIKCVTGFLRYLITEDSLLFSMILDKKSSCDQGLSLNCLMFLSPVSHALWVWTPEQPSANSGDLGRSNRIFMLSKIYVLFSLASKNTHKIPAILLLTKNK